MRTSGHKDGQEDADDPPDGREDGHGEDRGPHDDALEEHTHFIVSPISTSKLPSLWPIWHGGNLGTELFQRDRLFMILAKLPH